MDIVRIDRAALPPQEYQFADATERNLFHLQMAAEEFRSTVELYLFCHNRKLFGYDNPQRMISWISIAGRNGSVVTYGAYMVMQAINSMNAPTLRSKVNMVERVAATKLFSAEFKDIGSIRHSAAHPGELSATEEEFNRHRLKEDMVSGLGIVGTGSYVTGGMVAENDKLIYTASFAGKPVSYELSMRKADVLDKVARHYCRAFYGLEGPDEAARREQIRQMQTLQQQN